MAVDLMSLPNMDDQVALQEAASQGLKGMEHLIRLLSHQSNQAVDCSHLAGHTVSKFKKVISLLNRTGHARFRRGPVQSSSASTSSPSSSSPPLSERPIYQKVSLTPATVASPVTVPTAPVPTKVIAQPTPASVPSFAQSQPQSMTLDFSKPNLFTSKPKSSELEFSVSSNSSFISSAITGDGSVSNGKQGSSIFLAPGPAVSAGKPPLSSTPYKKRCHEHDHSQDVSGKLSGSANGKCHCSKRRKNRVKRVVRVPVISNKFAEIPPDEYSWRKYGQKPIKGSPYPRGYYKCSTIRGCPARKHVERALDDPTMLVVTYEGEHRHAQPALQDNLTPGLGLVFEST